MADPDVLGLSFLALDAAEGRRLDEFLAAANPQAIARICSELLTARQVVEAVRHVIDAPDQEQARERWKYVRTAMISNAKRN